MTELSLGERLKAANERTELQKLQAENAKKREEEIKFANQHTEITSWLEMAMERFTVAIMNETKLKPIEVPNTKAFDTYKWKSGNRSGHINTVDQFVAFKHPHADAFVNIFEWAEQNDLEVRFTDCHDGVGIRSWWELSVLPKL